MTGPAKMRVKAFAADASQVRRARVVGIDAGAGKPIPLQSLRLKA